MAASRPADQSGTSFRTGYVDLMGRIQSHVSPRTYLEIGVASGRTLALAPPTSIAVGIDPRPRITKALGPNAHVFAMESDDFFSEKDVGAVFEHNPVDLAFIDGMHLFEFALQDFMNIERYSAGESVVLVHDCLPIDEVSARRQRETELWTGDVWKMILCLRRYRPDLEVSVVDVPPSGLGFIRHLDPSSTVLADNYDTIVANLSEVPFAYLEEKGVTEVLGVVPNEWDVVATMLPEPRHSQPAKPPDRGVQLLRRLRQKRA